MLKIGITGHRTLMNVEDVRDDIRTSLRYFMQIDKDIVGISAIATGADTLFAQEIEKVNGDLKIILPFNADEYTKDFGTPDSLREFERLKKMYKNDLKINSEALPEQPDARNELYLANGKRIADEADILLAVWDGKDAAGIGGTGDIVNYAKKLNKEVHIIKAIRKKALVKVI